MTKKPKIDLKKRKNGDNFLMTSSIIIFKKYQINQFLSVFLAKFEESGCMNTSDFLKIFKCN